MINSDGTAATWAAITVSVTPPGEDSRSRVRTTPNYTHSSA